MSNMNMTREQALFIFVCQTGTLSMVTYLYMTDFFGSDSRLVGVGKYIDLFLTYGIFPFAWLLIALQAWVICKNRH